MSISMSMTDTPLATLLARRWWLLLLRGLAAIAFGFLSWRQPVASATALVLLFGGYALVDGVLNVGVALTQRRQQDHKWLLLFGGLLGIGVGVLTFVSPAATLVALTFYIAVWSVATGVLQIVAAVRLRQEIQGEWLLILGGLLSIVLGGWLMVQPGLGVVTLVWLIATYAVLYGILMVMLAFKVRAWAKTVPI